MPIVTISFFDGGELNVPGTDATMVSEPLTDIMGIYEPEYLQKALGYPLWKLVNAALNPGPVPVGRFQDLITGGVEYTDGNGFTKLWPGLNTAMNSPVAKYIWYWYQRKKASYSSSQGEQKGKTENAENVGVATKQMQHWNSMSRATCEMWDYLTYSKDGGGAAKYSEFDINQVDVRWFAVINAFNI